MGPRILEAPRVERVSALGELGITLKILARSAPRSSGRRRRATQASAEAFQENGIDIRIVGWAAGGRLRHDSRSPDGEPRSGAAEHRSERT